MRNGTSWLGLVPSLSIWAAFFVLPAGWFLTISFWRVRAYRLVPDFTLDHYGRAIDDYGRIIAGTLLIAYGIALAATILGLAFALYCRFRAGRFGDTLFFAVLVTLFGGYLTKLYAWKIVLGTDGILNSALRAARLVDEPISFLLYSPAAVVLTLVNYLLPLAVLPIYGSLRSIGDEQIEAARDLGAGFGRATLEVVLPQAAAGIAAAFASCFLFAAGDYLTAAIVGGPSTSMIGTFIESQFGHRLNQPLGAALSFTVVAAAAVVAGATTFALRRLVGAR